MQFAAAAAAQPRANSLCHVGGAIEIDCDGASRVLRVNSRLDRMFKNFESASKCLVAAFAIIRVSPVLKISDLPNARCVDQQKALQTRSESQIDSCSRKGFSHRRSTCYGSLFSMDAYAVVITPSGRATCLAPLATRRHAIAEAGRNTIKTFSEDDSIRHDDGPNMSARTV